VAIALALIRSGAVGFIDWLDAFVAITVRGDAIPKAKLFSSPR
jgi:hypothetical protein